MRAPRTTREWLGLGALGFGMWVSAAAVAAEPDTLHFQGRVAVDGVPFTGQGEFKFALIDDAHRTVWGSAPDRDPADGEPDTTVRLSVQKGLYAVNLGKGMEVLPADVMPSVGGLRLRVWFDDGTHGMERLEPDAVVSAVPYARAAGKAETARVAEQFTGSLPATRLQGTLKDEQLPSTIARLDSSPVFTGTVQAEGFSGAGTFGWRRVVEARTEAGRNEGVLADRADGPVLVVLPANASAGDVVRVSGVGVGGWRALAATGEPLGEIPWVHQLEGVSDGTGIACSGDGRRWMVTEGVNPSTGRGGFWESKDGGAAWADVRTDANWLGVTMARDGRHAIGWRGGSSPGFGTFGYAGQFPGVDFPPGCVDAALSADGGVFTAIVDRTLYTQTLGDSAILGGLRDFDLIACAMSGTGERMVAVGRLQEGVGLIWVSSDFGRSWIRPEVQGVWQDVASSDDGMRLVAVEERGRVWISTDGGTTWSPRLENASWMAVGMSADGQCIAVAQRQGGIWYSMDGGEVWGRSGPAKNWHRLALSSDGLRVGGIATGDGVYLGDFSEWGVRGGRREEAELRSLGAGRWSVVRPALLGNDDGQLNLATIPGLPAEMITSGVLDTARIPLKLTGLRFFSGPVEVAPTSAGTLALSEAASLGVVVDNVNPTMGYGLSLHSRAGTPVWKLGVGTDKDFSLGAAGKRDRDIAVDFDVGSVALGGQPVANRKLMVYGDQESTGSVYAGGVRLTSDARLKQDVAPVEHALDKISALRGVGFAWRKESPVAPIGTGRELGFLAQDVATVLPDLVRTNENGFLSLNYEGVTPVLVEALKELRWRHETELARRDGEIRELRDRLLRLESHRVDSERVPWPAASAANP